MAYTGILLASVQPLLLSTKQPRTQALYPGYEVVDKARERTRERLNLVPEPAILGKEREARLGLIRCRKPGILAKIELRIPFQRPIRFLPETDYPRASRSFPRIAGSGNEIENVCESSSVPGPLGTEDVCELDA